MAQDCFVMKCGGSTLAALPDPFYEDLSALQASGRMPVIVHGGGPAISEALEKYEIKTEFVDGLRKTTDDVLNIVEMVLSGQINKQIVRRLREQQAAALGLSGVDGRLLYAERIDTTADIGYVGEVHEVNAALIRSIVELGYTPVIAPVGMNDSGQRFNINADTAAGAVASALHVKQLVVVTDVPGIMRPIDGEFVVQSVVTVEDIAQMITDGTIYGGMIPKVHAAMKCLEGGVEEVVIVDGAEVDVLSRLLNGEEIGTRIVSKI